MNWTKTIAISLPMFIVGYLITYGGFKAITANPNCSEQEMELFFLYCSPNVAFMTIALFLIVRKVKLNTRSVALFSNIAKCGLGIYMVHYFVVGFSYSIANTFSIPVSIRIPVTAAIVFIICWALVATCYKFAPKSSKWIFGWKRRTCVIC